MVFSSDWRLRRVYALLSSPGSEYVVAGHEDRKTGQLMINAKSLIKSWKSTLGRKILHILRKDCGRR